MVMDYLRSCYRTQMRLVAGSDELFWVRWFWACKDAKTFPYHHYTASEVWRTDHTLPCPGIGEASTSRTWANGNWGDYTGKCYTGKHEWFIDGIPSEALDEPPVCVCKCCHKPDDSGTECGGDGMVRYFTAPPPGCPAAAVLSYKVYRDVSGHQIDDVGVTLSWLRPCVWFWSISGGSFGDSQQWSLTFADGEWLLFIRVIHPGNTGETDSSYVGIPVGLPSATQLVTLVGFSASYFLVPTLGSGSGNPAGISITGSGGTEGGGAPSGGGSESGGSGLTTGGGGGGGGGSRFTLPMTLPNILGVLRSSP